MIKALIILVGIALGAQALLGLTFLISSWWEKEKRAAFFAAVQFAGMLVLFLACLFLASAGIFNEGPGFVFLIAVSCLGIMGAIVLIRKTPANPRALKGTEGYIVGKVERQDERTIVFARNRSLKPGSKEYDIFYKQHPEYEEYDAKRRLPGGIAGPPGKIDRPREIPNVAATISQMVIPLSLSGPEKVKPKTPPPLKDKKSRMSPEEATVRVKGFARHMGADLVGVTELNPNWIYSHRGEIFNDNWEDWGREIPVEHKYAVVFATEMSFDMIASSPHTPTLIESNFQYARGSVIATQLASFIAGLGFDVTANHFRHYETVLVPLAVDAGLGELSRMGYLLTKELGPRLRLAAVTTDMPLIPDKPKDIGAEDFCKVCKKCAVCCPSQSIPMEDKEEVNGSLRWKLNAETCFEYWAKLGTGCNICMRVCPWSHARTFPHKVILELVERNMISRRLFIIMDDIFYGRKPRPGHAPQWADFN